MIVRKCKCPCGKTFGVGSKHSTKWFYSSACKFRMLKHQEKENEWVYTEKKGENARRTFCSSSGDDRRRECKDYPVCLEKAAVTGIIFIKYFLTKGACRK